MLAATMVAKSAAYDSATCRSRNALIEDIAIAAASKSGRSRGYSRTKRKRSELVITDTELKLMAAAAMTGLSSRPKAG